MIPAAAMLDALMKIDIEAAEPPFFGAMPEQQNHLHISRFVGCQFLS